MTSADPPTLSLPSSTNRVPAGLIVPSNGPYYVVFGRDLLKIHEHRPAGLGLGINTPILPFVITCKRREEAVAAASINHAVFSSTTVRDAHALAYLVQQSHINVREGHIYSIVRGGNSEAPTGVYVGFPWMELDKYIRPDKSAAHWRKRPSLQDAIIYMMSEKPGSNIPILSPGRPIPPAPSLLEPEPSCPDENASDEASDSESASGAVTEDENAENDVFYDAMVNLSIESKAGGVEDVVCKALAQVILPLPSMEDGKPRGRYPVTLGSRADKMLASRGVSETEIWKVLSARVHCTTVEAFSYHMGMALQWSPMESTLLWEAIHIPSL